MLTEQNLNAAVLQNIITPAQRGALLDLARGNDPVVGDESTDEALRLVGGGNDLFVTVGVVLLLAGLFFVLTAIGSLATAFTYGIIATVIWVIAEIVTRQKRMRLSSTVLAVLFMGAIAELISQYLSTRIDFAALETNPLAIVAMRGEIGWLSLGAAAVFIVAAIVYFWRFGVPVLAAIIALALTALGFVQIVLFLYDGVTAGSVAVPSVDQIPGVIRDALYLPLIAGLMVFGVAVGLDLHDRERRTLWSDCAFWLHLVSAPLLVHPLFIMATGQDVAFGRIEAGQSAIVMLTLLIIMFVYVALAIDRRSLLVPTLGYFGSIGIYALVSKTATETGLPPFALILLGVGAIIILFGTTWHTIRRVLIKMTLPKSIVNRLPVLQ
ncbi:MAG: hypothetical protein ACRCT6_06715 [Notoacmeibacter sp.]